MGAISFNLDEKLVDELQRYLPLRLFVETGTFRGESLESVRPYFDECISIELSPKYHAAAQKRFAGISNIRLLLGDSGPCLKEERKSFEDVSTLFWLDAHWCAAENVASEKSQCPLLDELASIGSLNEQSVVLIDDARLFLTPPPKPHEVSSWPDFSELLSQFIQLSEKHSLAYYNDVLLFIPSQLIPKLRPFFQDHTFNLLTYGDKVRDYDSMLELLRNKTQRLDAEIIRLRDIAEQHGAPLTLRGSNLADEVILLRSQLFECQRQLQIVQTKLHQSKITALKPNRRKPNKIWGRYLTSWQRHLASNTPNPLGKLQQYPPRPIRPERFPRKPRLSEWPRICVITPSYQQGHFLERTMLSVLDQGYSNLAYGVQDGGSTDESVTIINRHISRLSHAESAPDEGQSDAIQRGFTKLSPGYNDIMCWVNSDDVLTPGALHYVGAYFARHPHVDVIYGHRIIIDEHDEEVGRWFMPRHHHDTLKWTDLVPQETMFWRSHRYYEIGGLDKSFQFALDWDILLRFEYAGFNIQRLPYFLGGFRVHEKQKTNAKIYSIGEAEMDLLRRRIHEREIPSWEIHRHLSEEVNRSALVEWLSRWGIRY